MIPATGQRVLHLVEPWAAPAPGRRRGSAGPDVLTAACALAAGPGDVTLVLGPASSRRRAARLGLRPVGSICPPLSRPALASGAVRRFIRQAGPFDAAVCWGDRLAALAPRIAPLVPSVRAAVFEDRGSSSARLPISHAASGTIAARRWREAHGIGPDEVVIALLDDPADAPNARKFAFILGALEVSGVRPVGVVPSGTSELARARRFRRSVGLCNRLLIADRPMLSLLDACDLGLLLGPFVNTLPARFTLQLAGASGVPVVTAADDRLTGGLPEEVRARCLASSDHTTDLGRLVLELTEDRAARERLSAVLRDHGRNGGGIAGPVFREFSARSAVR